MPRYLNGISIAALGRGNRRMLAPLRARHGAAKAEHAELVAALAGRRAKAREIKDPEARAKALAGLAGERPTHPTLVAIGCAVVAAVVGWPMLRGHHATALSVGLTMWVITALILGQKQPAAEDPAEEGTDGTAPPASPTAAETHTLTATLAAAEGSLLLTRLTAELASRHPRWEASTKATRALLAEAGIRVRDGVRTAAGNGPGIHQADAPPLPSPSAAATGEPVVANVAADQSANTNANNAPVTPSREGFTSQPDPDNPARTIITHAA